jgi:hypothetical protein
MFGKGMFGKRNLESDADKLLKQVRKRYDDYIVQFMKPSNCRNGFEERYIDALRARISMPSFLRTELEVIEEMIQQEQDDENMRAEEAYKRMQRKQRPSLAERVFAEYMARIEHYPDLEIHGNASYEMKKLFGALFSFERDYWPAIDKVLRGPYGARYTPVRQSLEERMWSLGCLSKDGCPSTLKRYIHLLTQIPRNHGAVEREEKRCLIEAAAFLHSLSGELTDLIADPGFEGEVKETVVKALEKVHIMLSDFRLTDLKPSQGRRKLKE